MFTFIALMLLLIAFAVLTVSIITIGIGGAAFMIVFADWIVFMLIIGLVIKWILNRRK